MCMYVSVCLTDVRQSENNLQDHVVPEDGSSGVVAGHLMGPTYIFLNCYIHMHFLLKGNPMQYHFLLLCYVCVAGIVHRVSYVVGKCSKAKLSTYPGLFCIFSPLHISLSL